MTELDKTGLEAALRSAYEKVAAWPENRMAPRAIEELGEGFTDLLKLRNLVPDVLAYLSATSAGVTEEQVESAWAAWHGSTLDNRAAMRAALEASRVAPVSQKEADDRLFDADEPMADGEVRMTAAEEVLAWLLIEKVGFPDDRSYSPNEAQAILSDRLDTAREIEAAIVTLSLSEHEATDCQAPAGEPGIKALWKAVDAPERIWLSAADSDSEREVWTDADEGGTEYVRADLAVPVGETANG